MGKMQIAVRLAEKKDVERIAELASKIFDEARISDADENVFFIAESGKKLVGFAHLIEKQKRVILQGLGVDEDFRGAGVGSRLLDTALLYCEANGADEVVLKVKALNPAAKLYLERGFFAKRTGDVYTFARKKPT